LDTECDSVDELATITAEAFAQHQDYPTITSFPGLADTARARVLAEIGNDRNRFTDTRALKAIAGSAPVTGRSRLCLGLLHAHQFPSEPESLRTGAAPPETATQQP
jgi:Transposase IS116/IS110/IS902 family